MPRARPRAVRQYRDEFKLTAVRLSQQPELQVKTVAAALGIHPLPRHASRTSHSSDHERSSGERSAGP